MTVAAWGSDTLRLARAAEAARDSIERLDSVSLHPQWRADLDSARALVHRRTGYRLTRDTIAAGYALDRAALALAVVADSALLDVGGQFLWIGPESRSTARSVGIPDPRNSLATLAAVQMQRGAVSTTSDRDGPTRSVTVLAPDAVTAAAWSRVLLVLGCDSALAMAAEFQRWGMGVVCADSSGVRWTPDLENRVRVPTGAAGASAVPPEREP